MIRKKFTSENISFYSIIVNQFWVTHHACGYIARLSMAMYDKFSKTMNAS